MIRVAVDAMGGDNAPQAEIEGSLLALAEHPDATIQLVGRPDVIEAELVKHPGADRSRIEIRPASEVIGMADKPLASVRSKRDSSIVVGLGLQKAGTSDAFVSAGNTGAVLAASTLLLGLHDGVERASVATLFPTADAPVLVLDGGANVDCSARELVGFARLGTVYMRDILGRPNPAVGLLNVGEEDEKGTAVVKEAHQLLKGTAGLHYIGNIEGRDILAGHEKHGAVDVVVCDGFVGNVVLKFYESVARLIVRMLRRDAPSLLERDDIRTVFRALDYSEYGGAPLLGVRGIAIICHGSSGPNSIRHAVRIALQSVRAGLSAHIGAEMAPREGARA
ncbi:MAG TPA: phosphate acyltransferase PlsX [Gemmatimonadales bacterium]|nr:phosphate acyltransferase PlsX [Gemmatimonadales bacterium]